MFFSFKKLSLIGLLLVSFNLCAQTDFSIPLVLDFDETTLNRVIYHRFNKQDIPKVSTVVVNNVNINFKYIVRPIAEISNKLDLRVLFTIDYSNLGIAKIDSYQVRIPFVLESIYWNIDTNDAIEDGIYLTLNGQVLNQRIDEFNIPTEHKNLAKTMLGNLTNKSWKISDQKFDAGLLTNSSQYIDYKIKELPVLTASVDGNLKLTIQQSIQVKKPKYIVTVKSQVSPTNSSERIIEFKIESNVMFALKQVNTLVKNRATYRSKLFTTPIQAIKVNELYVISSVKINNDNWNSNYSGTDEIEYFNFLFIRDEFFGWIKWNRPCTSEQYECLTRVQEFNNYFKTFYGN